MSRARSRSPRRTARPKPPCANSSKRATPDHGILGEEGGATRADSPWQWVLDPIDGTHAFLAGFPLFGTLIGLLHRGRPVLGIVDQPAVGERFTGSPGGATLNGRAIACRPCAGLDHAVAAATDPAMFTAEAEAVAWAQLRRRAAAVQLGGNCYAYAMLAGISRPRGRSRPEALGTSARWSRWCRPPAASSPRGTAALRGKRTKVVACGDRRVYAEVAPLLAGAA